MIDYYEFLGISKEISEEELNNKLNSVLEMLENKKDIGDKKFNLIAYYFYYNFKKTLENYGSKANYDKALLQGKKFFKIIVLNKNKLKKKSLKFVIVGTIIGTIISNSYKSKNTTQINISEHNISISQMCNKYDININDFKLDSLTDKFSLFEKIK